jgi:hypothetical protein
VAGLPSGPESLGRRGLVGACDACAAAACETGALHAEAVARCRPWDTAGVSVTGSRP